MRVSIEIYIIISCLHKFSYKTFFYITLYSGKKFIITFKYYKVIFHNFIYERKILHD